MNQEQFWAVFHNLWTRDVGTAGYDKRKWIELETYCKRVLQENEDLHEQIEKLEATTKNAARH